MQMKQSTDYVIRCVLCLARKKNREYMTAGEIGTALKVSIPYTRKILLDLRNADIVNSVQGVNGGYYLKKIPQEITMLDLIRIEDHTIRLNGSPPNDKDRQNGSSARIDSYFDRLQDIFEKYLQDATVEDFLSPPVRKTNRKDA